MEPAANPNPVRFGPIRSSRGIESGKCPSIPQGERRYSNGIAASPGVIFASSYKSNSKQVLKKSRWYDSSRGEGRRSAGARCNRSVVFASLATHLLQTQNLMCCIDQLNPPLIPDFYWTTACSGNGALVARQIFPMNSRNAATEELRLSTSRASCRPCAEVHPAALKVW